MLTRRKDKHDYIQVGYGWLGTKVIVMRIIITIGDYFHDKDLNNGRQENS